MTQAGRSINTQAEARGCIYACLAADNPREAVSALVGDINSADDPSILKVAEFALLKAPIIAGVRSYLENPFYYVKGSETSDPHALYSNVGEKTAAYATEALEKDPNVDLVQRINSRRVYILRKRGKESPAAIDGVFDKIDQAARSAAITTYAAALVNAYEIDSSSDLRERDRTRYIAAIKLSGELPRALTRIHLQQANTAHTAVVQHGKAIQQGHKTRSINAEVLRTDPEGVAHMKSPLKDWLYPIGGIANGGGRVISIMLDKIGDKEVRDVQIGCLLSFDPILATNYYRHYVDLMEVNNVWPAELQS